MCKQIWDQEPDPVTQPHSMLGPTVKFGKAGGPGPKLWLRLCNSADSSAPLYYPFRFQVLWSTHPWAPLQAWAADGSVQFSPSHPQLEVIGAGSSEMPGENRRQAMAICPALEKREGGQSKAGHRSSLRDKTTKPQMRYVTNKADSMPSLLLG